MELYGFMLANYAEVNRGLLYIQGGGWEFTTVSETPTILPAFIAGHIALEADSDVSNIALETALETPSGQEIAVASTVVSLQRKYPVDGEVKLEPLAFQVPLPVSGDGQHAVLLSASGTSVRIPLFIRMPPNT